MSSESFSQSSIRHAKLPFAIPQVQPQHPFRNKQNHDSLLEYCQQRLSIGKDTRDAELDRLVRIDKKVAGWIRMKDEDKKRREKSDVTGEPLLTNMNLPLTFIHLDDMMTYLADTFAPSRGMFYNTGTPNEMNQAAQLVTKMNNDALYAGYYRELLQTLFSCLKYNMGGLTVAWGSDHGPSKADGSNKEDRVFDSGVKWQGNRLKTLDRYNTLLDPSVHPTRLHIEGEFCAYVELKSRFWVQTRAVNGQFYNCEEAVKNMGQSNAAAYYRHPPAEARLESDTHAEGEDWVSVLSAMPSNQQDGHEVVTLYIRLNPTEFGLVPREEVTARRRYEIWRVTILDNKHIVALAWQNNVHNHIPCYFGVIHDDVMGPAQRSPGELLAPLQDFASHLLNVHMEAARKSIYGTTVYDPTMVNLESIPKGEVAARLPVEPRAYGRDVRTYIQELRTTHDTSHTMQDLETVMAIVNQFFPTQALPSQIASIERAVSSQVAAVQHGANRRQQKTARLLDDSMFRPMRFAMYYNILQFQPDGEEITDFYSGRATRLDISAMTDTNLPYIIGQGLKAIDRQTTSEMLQKVIFALIQAPAAAQGIDLLGLIDYWTSMIDIDMNMQQFRVAPPPAEPAATEEGQPAVNSVGVPIPPPGQNQIRPATDPAQIAGGPIFG